MEDPKSRGSWSPRPRNLHPWQEYNHITTSHFGLPIISVGNLVKVSFRWSNPLSVDRLPNHRTTRCVKSGLLSNPLRRANRGGYTIPGPTGVPRQMPENGHESNETYIPGGDDAMVQWCTWRKMVGSPKYNSFNHSDRPRSAYSTGSWLSSMIGEGWGWQARGENWRENEKQVTAIALNPYCLQWRWNVLFKGAPTVGSISSAGNVLFYLGSKTKIFST